MPVLTTRWIGITFICLNAAISVPYVIKETTKVRSMATFRVLDNSDQGAAGVVYGEFYLLLLRVFYSGWSPLAPHVIQNLMVVLYFIQHYPKVFIFRNYRQVACWCAVSCISMGEFTAITADT